MTPDQIALVRSTFNALPVNNALAKDFYERLFAICPHIRPMFADDITAQRVKLMQTLTAIITDLDKPDRLLPMLADLARRHVGYGTRDEHYALVGVALIGTLRHVFGALFTRQVETAWCAAYGDLSDAMIQAGRRAAA